MRNMCKYSRPIRSPKWCTDIATVSSIRVYLLRPNRPIAAAAAAAGKRQHPRYYGQGLNSDGHAFGVSAWEFWRCLREVVLLTGGRRGTKRALSGARKPVAFQIPIPCTDCVFLQPHLGNATDFCGGFLGNDDAIVNGNEFRSDARRQNSSLSGRALTLWTDGSSSSISSSSHRYYRHLPRTTRGDEH